MKFKVGDCLQFNDAAKSLFDVENVWIRITNVDGKVYHYDRFSKTDNSFLYNHKYSIHHIDAWSLKYYLIIKDTKLARKVHKNKIQKEEDGYLWIKH